jgi:hypothetical protein
VLGEVDVVGVNPLSPPAEKLSGRWQLSAESGCGADLDKKRRLCGAMRERTSRRQREGRGRECDSHADTQSTHTGGLVGRRERAREARGRAASHLPQAGVMPREGDVINYMSSSCFHSR